MEKQRMHTRHASALSCVPSRVCESYILFPHSPASVRTLKVPFLILPSLLSCSLSSLNPKTCISFWSYSALKPCEPQARLFLPPLPQSAAVAGFQAP